MRKGRKGQDSALNIVKVSNSTWLCVRTSASGASRLLIPKVVKKTIAGFNALLFEAPL